MSTAIPVSVVTITDLSDKVVGIRLAPTNARPLPSFEPGAHIELQVPNGAKRSYSLTSSPSERWFYEIAVGRSDKSRGGSRYICEELYEGETLLISAPQNNFRLSESASKHVFVAGGIGLTPFISMATRAASLGHEVEIHLALRSANDVPHDLLHSIKGAMPRTYISQDGERMSLQVLLHTYEDEVDKPAVYFCGPASMLAEARALTQHWPAGLARFESFAPPPVGKAVAGEVFIVKVQRDGRRFPVGSRETMLDRLRAEGYAIGSSCEHGSCGSCRIRHIEGEVIHCDTVLSAEERASWLTCCVSRGRGEVTVDL